jgi:hypothetical protein
MKQLLGAAEVVLAVLLLVRILTKGGIAAGRTHCEESSVCPKLSLLPSCAQSCSTSHHCHRRLYH